jgi:hypothetical protein
MPINAINKLGPICFKSETLNFSSGSSINSLIENFKSLSSDNFSLSSSLTDILKRTGDTYTNTQTTNENNAVGTSLTNYKINSPIRFSSFYNATYLSASIKIDGSDGSVIATAFSPSVIRTNNFLTQNNQDQIYKYTLYTKTGTTTPIVDSGWTKVYSFTKSGNNLYKFYDLVNANSYKIVVKDCLSNAFTSSMFVGTCTDTVVTNNSYYYKSNSVSFSAAASILLKEINDDTNLNLNQKLDLITIIKNLENIIKNPKIYKISNNVLTLVLTYKDSNEKNRNLYFDGLIYQDVNKNYIFNGSVYAHSVAGSVIDYYYSFEDTKTSGTINLYVIANQTVTGTNCANSPSKIGYFPTSIYINGPVCGNLDCGTGKAQPVCNPTSYSQIRHSGSFTITNDNDDIMTVEIENDWKDPIDESPPGLLGPITILPSYSFTIPAKSSKKLSIRFGSENVSQYQPSKFILKTNVNFSLPSTVGYTPNSQTSEIRAIFDKNSCLIGVPSPFIISQASNVGNVYYTATNTDTWQTSKTKLNTIISNSYGIYSDKLYSTSIVDALPLTGCILPSSITVNGVVLTLTWTQITTSPIQANLCNDNQFSGTYNVTVSNSIYGLSSFYIYFLRKNDNSLGSYINLTQLGGTSNPF